MKKISKGIVILLMFVMLGNMPGMETLALDIQDQKSTTSTAENENVTGNDEEILSPESQSSTDANINESEIAYLYVDQSVVYAEESQHIVVGFKDSAMLIDSATLQYKADGSEEILQLDASAITEGAALFSQEYSPEELEQNHSIIGITYQMKDTGEQKQINFADEGFAADYYVTQESFTQEETTNFTAYSVDAEGNTVEKSGDSIEEIVENALDESEEAISTAEGEKTGVVESIKKILSMGKVNAADKSGNLVVALSAGHDATHTGANANGLAEETLNLKVAQYCKEELEQYAGVKVYMTRTTASCPYPGTTKSDDNYRRIDAAIANGADVYVDIHFNSGGGTGAEIFYPNSSYNASIGANGGSLANEILNQLTALGLTNRGAKIKNATDGEKDGNGVLADYYTTNNYCKERGIPGIIVEHAFLDSASDAARLKDENFIRALGVADATGIARKYGLSKGAAAKPSISNVSIVEKNDFQGTFTVKIDGVSPRSNVKMVQAAVWSTVGGQDDLVWYTAKDQGSGVYSVPVDIVKNHKNSLGEYSVHIYITDTAGGFEGMEQKTTGVMSKSSATTKVDLSAAKTNVNASATITNIPSGLNEVQFAVWSEASGQDDLKWYTGTKDANTWNATINLSAHKSYGLYNVHSYVKMVDGSMIHIGTDTVNVSYPTASSITVGDINTNTGTFDVIITGITAPLGISKIEVPVWCSSNQSDLYWYNASKQSDGSYKVTVNIANHKYAEGTYTIHTYLSDSSGVKTFLGNTNKLVALSKATITATKADSTEKQYNLQAQGIVIPGGISKVQFAVWSEVGGQDDLVWYTANKNASGAYVYTVPISAHKSTGAYNVHVYATTTSGMKNVGTTVFNVTTPTVSTVITKNQNAEKGTFDVVVSGISSPSGVTKIQIPVWCSSNQSDIYWYEAVKQSDGTYMATVNIANHKYSEGTYQIHTYLTDGNGIRTFVKGTTNLVSLPQATLSATKTDPTEKNYKLQVQQIVIPGGFSKVQFAVWSEAGGQDDLIWYDAVPSSTGIYTYTMSTNRHKSTGIYQVHAYVTTSSGQKCIALGTFTVTAPKATIITIKNQNIEKGTFDVSIGGIESPSGVQKIEVPVWSTTNQSNIYWYMAIRQSDGTYSATVDIAKHNYSEGNYQIHIYLTDGNGIRSFVNSTSNLVAKPKATISAVKTTDEMKCALQAGNIFQSELVSKVEFAVWSDVGGQDDLVWYTGNKTSTNLWISEANISLHKTAGVYQVHAYATTKAGQTAIGTTTFTITMPSATITKQNYNPNNGTFDIIVSNIVSPSGVAKIQIPVWCDASQSDIKWYTAIKQSDGTYKTTVDPIYHGNHSGIYQIHSYITTGYGATIFLAPTTQIVSAPALYTIMGESTVSSAQLVAYYNASSSIPYPKTELGVGGADTINIFCDIYIEEAKAEGVRAEVAFAQAMLETGFLRFGGDVKISQYNFAGLGATGGVPGNAFKDVRTGIRAQIQHLKCYGSTQPLVNEKVDLRWSDSLRNKAPYVQWLSIPNNPYGSGWAADPNYGSKLLNMIAAIKAK